MQLSDLSNLPVLQTAGIAQACEDPNTLQYLQACLSRFMQGDYGLIGQEGIDANNADLAEGEGHILARYEQAGKLTEHINIEARFHIDKLESIDNSYIIMMYPHEQ